MKCAEFERQIALAVEGDLGATQAERLEAHLLACPACREFAGRLRESQAALKSLAEETPDPAALARVRARVLARIEAGQGRRPAPLWGWALAVAVIAVLLALATVRKPAAPVVAVRAPAAPAPSSVTAPPEPRPAPHVRVRRVRARPKRPAPGNDHPLLIKLLTDDPNIVIYWIVEKKGD